MMIVIMIMISVLSFESTPTSSYARGAKMLGD